MAKRMLIDAAHPEETRVVVLNGNRLEEFDFETSTKKQIKGNIYLAKVTRVEPSLQAAFVEYGGNRHGFLAFSEIHPDYYRIPIGDREALKAAEQRAQRISAASEEEGEEARGNQPATQPRDDERSDSGAEDEREDQSADQEPEGSGEPSADLAPVIEFADNPSEPKPVVEPPPPPSPEFAAWAPPVTPIPEPDGMIPLAGNPAYAEGERTSEADDAFAQAGETGSAGGEQQDQTAVSRADENGVQETPPEKRIVETVGGDEVDEVRRQRARPIRHYKIQEVVKRRQIMLVQVTKEERGNKGAALTTYLSLAGRYCVLMPNTDRGGGVSRKITSATDRRRLKELVEELQVPEDMGVIVRTAGSERSKAEIKRDFEYLLRLWDEIRELTLKSSAPALIYEEGNLIKRSIRDLYARDIDEVLVDGEEGYRTAKAFMKMLMPSHAKRVQPYRDPAIPLFHRFQVETQIDAIHSPVVQLRSGGYIVINQTEALVAIDVNSGRATKERNIEETALKTNLEAADEIARQLRLRDLAGLIVIDFIDMEEGRHQAAVERRLKEAMKNDRARIQLGRISPFGLLELSRQRLRPSLAEASTQPCPHCHGTGHIRSIESTALHVLRALEDEGIRRRTAELRVFVPTAVALYILNQKRAALAQIEQRYGFHVMVSQDDTLVPPAFRLERLRALTPEEIAASQSAAAQAPAMPIEEDQEDDADTIEAGSETGEEEAEVAETAAPAAAAEGREDENGHGRRRRRRRRRRRGDEREHAEPGEAAAAEVHAAGERPHEGGEGANGGTTAEQRAEGERRRRRRGKRGGRRHGRPGHEGMPGAAEPQTGGAESGEPYAAEEPVRRWHDEAPGYAAAEPAIADAPRPEREESVRFEPATVPAAEVIETVPPSPYRREDPAIEVLRDAVPSLPASPPAEPAASAPEAAAPPPEKPAEPEQPGGPPRRGWWQRLSGR